MSLIKSVLITVTLGLVSATSQAQLHKPSTVSQNNNFNSTLWVQTSAEYRALSLQAYHSAQRNLPALVADRSANAALEQHGDASKLPPAIVLDVDETILDNSPYQAQAVLENKGWDPVSWDRWIAKRAAKGIPGGVALVNQAAAMGIKVIFITNRQCKMRAGNTDPCPQKTDTVANLKTIGVTPISADQLMLKGEKPGWTSEKQSRREQVIQHYHIIMLFGDDLGDFLPNVKHNISVAQRAELVARYQAKWGYQWYILPNPTYGSWMGILGKDKRHYFRGFH